MSTARPEEEFSLSEYELTQEFPGRAGDADISPEEYAELKAEYGRVRAWAKTNPERFRSLQRSLSQARMGTTYDVYLAQCVRYAAVGTGVGLLFGLFIAAVLAQSGVFDGLSFPFAVGGEVAATLRANKVALASGVLTLGVALAAGAVSFLAKYSYPQFQASQRGKRINFLLPHAIVYMYALSYGGSNLVGIVNRLANSEDTYDEVANEFEAIRRDVELFGTDLLTAFQNRRNLTPSPSFERFLDDLVSVIDTGGDVTEFLETATESYLDDAEHEQEDFLESIAVYSEIYVAGFVAAPLFAVVILLVISFLGGTTLPMMYALIYVTFPVGMALFLGILVVLSSAYQYPDTRLSLMQSDEERPDIATLADDDRFKRYRRANRWPRLKQLARSPVNSLKRSPYLTLAFTVPIAAIYLVVAVVTGIVTPGEMQSAPIPTTTLLIVVPLLLVTVPLAVFHELKERREMAITDRLPASLNVLASANRMGIPFSESLDLLSRYTKGTLSREFRLTRNDLLWSHDLNQSLVSMAHRVNVSQFSRTVKLIGDGARSSGDLARILAIAATDARDRQRLLTKRRSQMSTYLAVVIIGFLVYLMVVVLLDIGYLRPIEEIAAESPVEGRSPVSLVGLPTDTYRMLLFHSVLIQAIGTGLIAGKLTEDSILSGLKYGIVLIAMSLVVFAFIH